MKETDEKQLLICVLRKGTALTRNHGRIGSHNFAVACKVADKHTITLPKRAYIRIPSGVASPVVHKG